MCWNGELVWEKKTTTTNTFCTHTQVSMLQAGAGLPDLRLGLVSNALGVPLLHLDVRQLQAALRHEAGQYLDATVSAMVGAGYFHQVS